MYFYGSPRNSGHRGPAPGGSAGLGPASAPSPRWAQTSAGRMGSFIAIASCSRRVSAGENIDLPICSGSRRSSPAIFVRPYTRTWMRPARSDGPVRRGPRCFRSQKSRPGFFPAPTTPHAAPDRTSPRYAARIPVSAFSHTPVNGLDLPDGPASGTVIPAKSAPLCRQAEAMDAQNQNNGKTGKSQE